MPVFASVGAYLHGFIRDLLPGNGLPDAIINRDRRSRRMLRDINGIDHDEHIYAGLNNALQKRS